MAKGVSKRTHHRQDMEKLNHTAMMIGIVAGIVILAVIILSFAFGGFHL